MIIVFIISKNKQHALKTVIFKKPIKTSKIINKRYLKNYDIKELKKPIDTTTKCITSNTVYTIKTELTKINSYKNMALIESRGYIEVKFLNGVDYDKNSLIPYLLELYMEAINNNDLDGYQMNLIGA